MCDSVQLTQVPKDSPPRAKSQSCYDADAGCRRRYRTLHMQQPPIGAYGPAVTRTAHAHPRDLRVVPANPPAFANSWRSSPPEAVFISMGEPLLRLIGREGYRALLERALHLASEDYPDLKTVRPALAPPGRLIGLPPPEQGDVHRALDATLSIMLTLLFRFLGGELLEELLCETDYVPSAPTDRATA